jgi:hypothetical protein
VVALRRVRRAPVPRVAVNPGAPPAGPVGPSFVSTTNQDANVGSYGVAENYQRGSFSTVGREWAFFVDDAFGGGPELLYSSSTDDGATWASPISAKSLGSGWAGGARGFDVHFDGTYVHLAIGISGAGDLIYVRGLPASDGTIAWGSEAVVASTATAIWEVSISTDSSGCPWISWENWIGGAATPMVSGSTTNDGTWSTRSGHPLALSSSGAAPFVSLCWTYVGRLDTSGKMIVFFWYGAGVYARVWSGSAWGAYEGPVDAPSHDAVDESIAMVTDPNSGRAYAAYNATSSGGVYVATRSSAGTWTQAQATADEARAVAIGFDDVDHSAHVVYQPISALGEVRYVIGNVTASSWAAQGSLLDHSLVGKEIVPISLQIAERARVYRLVLIHQAYDPFDSLALDEVYTYTIPTATAGAAPPPNLSGLAAGAGAMSGALRAPAMMVGSAAGSGLAAGALRAASLMTGASAASGSMTGSLSTPGGAALAGSSAATGSATGALRAASLLSGAGPGAGDASGALRAPSLMSGGSSAQGAMTGALRASPQLAATAPGAGAMTGALGAGSVPFLTGSMSAAGATAGGLRAPPLVTGSSAGLGSASGAATAPPLVSGLAAGASSASGNLTVPGTAVMSGSMPGGGFMTGSATASVRMAGAAAALGAMTGQATASGRLVGAATGLGLASGAITIPPLVTGSSTGVGGASGALSALARLAGSGDGLGAMSGGAFAPTRLTGAALGLGGATGAARAPTGLLGLAAGVGLATAALGTEPHLAGAAVGAGAASGEMSIGISSWPGVPGRLRLPRVDGRIARRPDGRIR